jgi:hypothetical protein
MTHEPNLADHASTLRSLLRGVMLLLWDLLVRFGLEERMRDWRPALLEELRDIRRAQACALVLAAQAQLAQQIHKPINRPPNAPHGCTRSRKRRTRRIVWRAVKAGRGLGGRIRAMRAFHESFDALVARMVARLNRGVPVAAYVMTCAPKEACLALACVETRAVDDS